MTAVPHVAIELAKRFEGFCRVPRNAPGRAYPYICPAGFWTIGYGHLCDQSHPPITTVEGEAYLAQDMQVALKATLRYCPVFGVPQTGVAVGCRRLLVWLGASGRLAVVLVLESRR